MSMFDGIENAAVSKSGQYFKEGSFEVELKEIKDQQSTASAGKRFFIIETVVVSSTNPEVPVRSERSQVIPMGEQMSFPNVKAFIAAASGVDPNAEDVNQQVEAYWEKVCGNSVSFSGICELVCGPAQPLKGQRMKLVCQQITTKAKKMPFTKHLWTPRDVSAEQ